MGQQVPPNDNDEAMQAFLALLQRPQRGGEHAQPQMMRVRCHRAA